MKRFLSLNSTVFKELTELPSVLHFAQWMCATLEKWYKEFEWIDFWELNRIQKIPLLKKFDSVIDSGKFFCKREFFRN